MSAKVYDGKGRFRGKTVAFRCSDEENAALDAVLAELKRIESGGTADSDLLDVIRLINTTLDGIKGGAEI